METDYEFIDESEVVFSRGNGRKPKKTESLFDSALTDRTYWGIVGESNGEPIIDPGTKLSMSIVRNKILKAIRNGYLIDLDDFDLSMRLAKSFRDELREYQMYLLFEMMKGIPFEIVRDEYGNYFINKEII